MPVQEFPLLAGAPIRPYLAAIGKARPANLRFVASVWTQEEIAERENVSVQPVKDAISHFGNSEGGWLAMKWVLVAVNDLFLCGLHQPDRPGNASDDNQYDSKNPPKGKASTLHARQFATTGD